MPVKVVFFGASGCGKSSIVQKYVFNEYIETPEPTVGAAYVPKIISFEENQVRLDIWDIAGPERYTILAPMFWKGAQIIVIVFDISDKSRSYERALIWVDYFKEAGCKLPLLFVGNKSDLPPSPDFVSSAIAKGYAERNGLLYCDEVSAKTGENIENLFLKITEIGVKSSDNEGPKIEEKPEWVPDSSCSKCCLCHAEFTFANRRYWKKNNKEGKHHCRCCGFVFCANCSSKKLPLAQFGIKKPVRVCVNCFNQENNKSSQQS